jgi:hypothetical protein
MNQRYIEARISALALMTLCAASMLGQATPATTTLSAERANNTSAADSFPGSYTGIAKAGHISPLPLSSLMPAGSTTRFIAHMVVPYKFTCHVKDPGCHDPVDLGYDQDSDVQIAREVADFQRRGISVVIVDWFGPGDARRNSVAHRLMKEVERVRATGVDISFGLQPDHGIERDCAKTECNTKLIEALTYAYNTFEKSPAYFRWHDRPVLPFFWNDRLQPVDWTRVKSSIPGNPLLIFRDAKGFDEVGSDGSFAWIGHKTPEGLDALKEFYEAAAKHKDKLILGTAYLGFDDRLAPWGEHRLDVQRCGMTWLDSIHASELYRQLTGESVPFIHLATWNDYDEGTPLEPGVGNCVTGIPAKVEAGHLAWSVAFGKDKDGATGDEATIAYFRIFVLSGKETLTEVARVLPRDKHELDLAPLHLHSGQKLYIEAVGQSMIQCHLSEPVSIP